MLADLYREAAVLGAAGTRAGRRLRPQRRRGAHGRAAPPRSPRSTRASGCSSAPSPCSKRRCAWCPSTRGSAWRWPTGSPAAAATTTRAPSSRAWSSRRAGGGRRKRAHLHQRLAEIARAQGDTALALAEFEQASSMDGSNPAILHPARRGGGGGGRSRTRRARLPHPAGADTRRRRPTAGPPDGRRRAGADGDPAAPLRPRAQARARRPRRTSCSTPRWPRRSRTRSRRRACSGRCWPAGAHDELARLFEKRLARAAGTPAEAEISAEMAESLRAQGKLRRGLRGAAARRRVRARERCRCTSRSSSWRARPGGWSSWSSGCSRSSRRRRRKADMGVGSTLLLLAADIAERDFGDQHARARPAPPRRGDAAALARRAVGHRPPRAAARRTSPNATASPALLKLARRRGAQRRKPPRRRCTGPPRWSSVAPRRARPASPALRGAWRRAAISSARRRWSRPRACPRRSW